MNEKTSVFSVPLWQDLKLKLEPELHIPITARADRRQKITSSRQNESPVVHTAGAR